MHKINFKMRALLYFLIVSIIPFAVSWTLIYKTYDREMQQDFKNFNYMYIQNQISKINQLLKQQEIGLKSIAKAYSHLEQEDTDLNAFLMDQKSVNQHYMNLSIIMPDGKVYTDDLNFQKPDLDYSNIDYSSIHSYTNARKAQQLVWLEPYTDPISNTECIGMSIPLLDKHGNESGVLVGNISLKSFRNLLVNAKYMANTEMFLINPSGYVKLHSGGKYSETVNVKDSGFILQPVADAVLQLSEGYREFSYSGEDWTCSFSVINASGWKVLSLIDANELNIMFDTMNQSTYSNIFQLGLLCVFIGLIASLFLSKSITTPLIELKEGVKSITAGNLDSRIKVTSNDEIREVADAFNEMADNLKNTYTDLVERTNELYLNNEELKSTNVELAASYGQLEAAMSQLNESDTQLRRKYSELQTLNRISNTLASTMDLNNMLITVVNQAVEITEALACAIRLIDDHDPNKLELKALRGIRTEKYDRGSIDIRYDIAGRAVEEMRTVVMELREDNIPHNYYEELFKKDEAKCVVFTPIIVKYKAIGVMCITLRQKPKDELIELINSLANNIAIAIDNAKAYETLKHSYLKTVQSLVSVVEAKDEYTESHSIRVAKYSSFIASEMKYPKSFVEDIWVAGVLHDIGKIGINDMILNKTDALTEDEYNIIKLHPDIAYRIVSKIGLKENILGAIRHHHERYDGKGYPDMIKGDDIPIMAAIISVADAFDAITSNRPYRKSRSIMQGINEIATHRGTQFNPAVVQALEKAFLLKQEVFEKIYRDEDIEFF